MEKETKLKQLERRFFLQKFPVNVTGKIEELEPTEKQRALIQSQLQFFYVDMAESDALQMLLKMTRQNRGRAARNFQDMQNYLASDDAAVARQFWDFCQQWNLVGFSFPELAVSNSTQKKIPVKIPQWHHIRHDNFSAYIDKNHCAFAFCTGKISNVTVIDCDTVDVYNEICDKFPTLKNTLTVRTRKGAHIYCQYTSSVPTSSKTFGSHFPNVDIRNDDGIVFAPPTTYLWPENNAENSIKYEFVDTSAPILPFPDQLTEVVINNNGDEKHQLFGVPRDITSVKTIKDITRKEVRSILKLFRVQPWMVTRTPVISNAIFEIGFHPPIGKSITHSLKASGRGAAEFGNCYYMKMFELMVIVINHGNWSKIESTMERFSNDLTFDVYKTRGGDYRLYCVSMPIFSRDNLAFKLQTVFECNPEAAQFSALNSWVTPLTNTLNGPQDVEILKVGRFGKASVIHDFTVLLDLKDGLLTFFRDHSDISLNAENLKNVLCTFEFPKFQKFRPFIFSQELEVSACERDGSAQCAS